MSTSSLLSKLSVLREKYERESSTVRKKFEKEINSAKAELDAILSADYVSDYKRKYSSSLASLERFYEEISAVHRRTRGISFRIYDYITSVNARPVSKGGVEGYFSRLVAECREAIVKVQRSSSIEADIAPLKMFCQGLVDLRHVVKNADKLLSESDAPKQDKEEAAAETRARLESIKAKAKNASKFENFECYEKCIELRNELNASLTGNDKNHLGASLEFDETYRFFMGYAAVNVPSEDRTFATEVLGVPDACFASSTPIFFNLTKDHSTIIIKAKHEYFSKSEFKNFIRNLYFTFASHLPQNGLQFTGIECGSKEAIAHGIEEQIKATLGDTAVYSPVIFRERDLMSSGGVVDKLEEEYHNRSAKYTFVDDIFEYNDQNPESRQSFIMLLTNNYPEGYSGGNTRPAEMILDAATWGAKGIISIICDSVDKAHGGAADKLDADALGASVIEIDKDGCRYDGMNATLFPTVPAFDARTYWESLKKYYSSTESLYLTKILSDTERDVASGKIVRPPFYKKLSVPIGMGDGMRYDMELDFKINTGFGILLGSTGSGKSASLHSFILSMAHFYSPNEVNLYLVDFKSDSKSDESGESKAPEFSHYKKIPGLRNLYVPHVKYLLLNSKSENALDLLDKIEQMRGERMSIIGNMSISEYNRRESEKIARGEKGKTLPYAIFIIDEINRMMLGDFNSAGTTQNSVITTKLAAKLHTILTQVRSAGIGIFFAGQNTKGIGEDLLGQIGTRVAMKHETENNLKALFKFDRIGESTEIFNKTTQGKALVSFEQGGQKSKRFVSIAYAGDPSDERALKVAEAIRKKYPECPAPVEAGSEKFFDAFEYKNYMPRLSEKKQNAMRDHILVGMTSASSSPVYLEYSREEYAKNYFAYSGAKKLSVIERSAIFSFIKSTNNRNIKYTSHRVSYLGLVGIKEETLDGYIKSEPKLAEDIKCVTSKREMAETILELANIYRERDRLNDQGKAKDFEPHFVVIRNVEWLTQGSDTSWMPDFKAEEKAKPKAIGAPSAEVKVDNAALEKDKQKEMDSFAKATGGKTLNPLIANMLAAKKQAEKTIPASALAANVKPKAETNTEKPKYTFDEVRNALKLIFNRGNRYGIFLLVTSSLLPPLKSVLFDAGAYSQNYAVYGSHSELERSVIDPDASISCAFVNPSFAKARLFEITPDNVGRFVYGD